MEKLRWIEGGAQEADRLTPATRQPHASHTPATLPPHARYTPASRPHLRAATSRFFKRSPSLNRQAGQCAHTQLSPIRQSALANSAEQWSAAPRSGESS